MKIIDSQKISQFVSTHPDTASALIKWLCEVEAATWRHHSDLKQTFPSADYVGNSRYVFNIRGNNYRLVCSVVFYAGMVIIRFIGTHSQYDKIDCKNI